MKMPDAKERYGKNQRVSFPPGTVALITAPTAVGSSTVRISCSKSVSGSRTSPVPRPSNAGSVNGSVKTDRRFEVMVSRSARATFPPADCMQTQTHIHGYRFTHAG